MNFRENIVRVFPSKNLEFNPNLWEKFSTDAMGDSVPSNMWAVCFAYAFDTPNLKRAFWRNVMNPDGVQVDDLAYQWKCSAGYSCSETAYHTYGPVERVLFAATTAGLQSISAEEAEEGYKNGEHIIAYFHHWGHFYRKDFSGFWTQKKGPWLPTNKDDAGEEIPVLEDAQVFYDYNGQSSQELVRLGEKSKAAGQAGIMYYRFEKGTSFEVYVP